MTDVSIPEMMYTMFSLLFLLLGVVLIASIIMSTINPYDQAAFANVEKLRASMDEACVTGQPVSIDFSLPQNTPKFTAVFSVMPIWMIKTNGDPNYVLYYESFPPGDGIGWEVYQNMQNRMIAYLPEGWAGKTPDEVADYAKKAAINAESRLNYVEGVVIGNILLGETRADYYLGSSERKKISSEYGEKALESANKYGEWSETEGDSAFRFKNYMALNDFEKSSIKYMPCGENSLCLKTRTAVYKFPLSHCNDIKAVQLAYDATAGDAYADILKKRIPLDWESLGTASVIKYLISRWSFSTIYVISTLVLTTKDVFVAEGGYKMGDFAVSSPCSSNSVVVEKSACNSFTYDSRVAHEQTNPCLNVMTYPMYKYEDGKLQESGTRNVCVEKIGDALDGVEYPTYGSQDQCLRVFFKNADNYCWTPTPYKKMSSFFNADEGIRSWVADQLGLNPVLDYSGWIKSSDDVRDMIVLTPTDVALEAGGELLDQLDRKWWWGWP